MRERVDEFYPSKTLAQDFCQHKEERTAIVFITFFAGFAILLDGVGNLPMLLIDHAYLSAGKELPTYPFSDNDKIQCWSLACGGRDNKCTAPHVFEMCSGQ